MTLRPTYPATATLVRFWGFCLDYSVKNSFAVSSVCETLTREINLSSANWLHSSLFLLVFQFIGKGLSLLGEVNRAAPVDNQRRRGAAIAEFRIVLFGSRIDLCLVSSRVSRTFRKIGPPLFSSVSTCISCTHNT